MFQSSLIGNFLILQQTVCSGSSRSFESLYFIGLTDMTTS